MQLSIQRKDFKLSDMDFVISDNLGKTIVKYKKMLVGRIKNLNTENSVKHAFIIDLHRFYVYYIDRYIKNRH